MKLKSVILYLKTTVGDTRNMNIVSLMSFPIATPEIMVDMNIVSLMSFPTRFFVF
jgi:hypothetical protein